MDLIAFDHRDSTALFAKAPHCSLTVKSRGTGNAKFGHLRASGTKDERTTTSTERKGT